MNIKDLRVERTNVRVEFIRKIINNLLGFKGWECEDKDLKNYSFSLNEIIGALRESYTKGEEVILNQIEEFFKEMKGGKS